MRIPRKLIAESVSLVDRLRRKKMVHYREVYKEIDHTNFYISTKTDFKRIKRYYKDIKEEWGRLKDSHKDSTILEYVSRSGSQYFITDKGHIYRYSNHWGAVASCEWTLNGEGQLRCSVFETGPWEIGKSNLKEFTLFIRKHLPRRDYIINPSWKEKILELQPVVEKLALLRAEETFSSRPVKDKIFIGESFGTIHKEFKSIGIKLT